MASVLNKDPFTYAEDRQRFLQDLHRFHASRGTPFDRIPQIGGREVDLYRLYRRVIDLGGWQKSIRIGVESSTVTVAASLGLAAVPNDNFVCELSALSFLQGLAASIDFFLLPSVAFRFTLVQCSSQLNNEQLWEDIVEEFKLPLACTNGIQALKHIYFRYLNIYEKVHFLGVDPDQAEEDTEDGPARKKVCLPIESVPLTYNYAQHKIQDNVRAASHLETNLLRFSEYEKLEMALRSGLPNEVDFAVNVCLLLSNEGRHVLKLGKSRHLLPLLLANIGIFDEGPATMEDVMLHSWRTTSKRDFLRFWHETVKDEKMRESITTKDGVYRREDPLGHEVLNLGRTTGVSDAEGQRVTQLAVLIRNLSFEEINQQLLASSTLVFRFLMLCVHSSYGSLRQLALDTLGNLAPQVVLEPRESSSTQLVLNLIKKSLVQEDKFAIVRALEILSKLCQLEKNESILNECLEEETYSRMVQLLTVHDIQLIVHTLEALYQLSELGDTTTSMISNVRNAVDLLVNLITVEAQSYGPNSLIGIKVVEYVPPPELMNATAAPSSGVHHSHVIQSVAPSHPYNYPAQHSPAASHQTSAEQQKADVEATASNWLQGTFEIKKGCCVTLSDLFADYQQFCRKFSVPDTLTSSDFLPIVKSAFPQADSANVEKADGEKDIVIKGLSKRAIPRPFAIHAGSDKVSKPCSVNSPRGPPPPAGTANWSQLGINTSMTSPYALVAPSQPIHTPTLRKRLMEPPRMALHQQLVPPTGTTAVGAPPTSVRPVIVSSSRPLQPVTPKPPDAGGGKSSQKKRQVAAAPPPLGPGPPAGSPRPPGMVATRPMLLPNAIGQRPVSVLQQHLQVAGAPQPAASVMLPVTTDHVLIQPSSTSLADQNDTNLIKSLLAKKVCQNMVRQGGSTPSHSPPPQDGAPEPMEVSQSTQEAQQPTGQQQHAVHQPEPQQQSLVIQSQPGLQQILQQPLQQLHIQPQSQSLQIQAQSQPLQIQAQSRPLQIQAHSQPLQIQAQSQPLQIQAHSQPVQIQAQSHPLQIQAQSQQQPQQTVMQTFQIQLPLYGLPQISATGTQIAAVNSYCTTLVHNPVVQTNASTGSTHLSLPQTTSGPYRAIIPNPCPSSNLSLSSQRPLAPSPGPTGNASSTPMIKTSQGSRSGSPVEGDLAKNSVQQNVEEPGENKQAQEGLKSTLHGALTAPSLNPQTLLAAASRTVVRDSDQTNPAVSTVQNQLSMSGGAVVHNTFMVPGAISSCTSLSHPSVNASVPSSSVGSSSVSSLPSHIPAPHVASMSLTQAILASNASTVGNRPQHTGSPAQPGLASLPMDNQAGAPSSNAQHPANAGKCNGVSDSVEANGILGSPDSVSNELPPSPLTEGVKKGSKNEQYLPNGLVEDSIGSLKECSRSRDLLNNVVEKAAKVNGLVHHMENGNVKEGMEGMDVAQGEGRVPKPGEKVRTGEVDTVDGSKGKPNTVQFNGNTDGSDGVKVEHGVTAPIPHRDREQVLSKQTSMEEVSMDSADLQVSVSAGKLLVNGGKTCDGGRPLFSPDSSRDSDLSSDSFASSIADSVASDKHSSAGPHSSFLKPVTAPSSTSQLSTTSSSSDCTIITAGTVPMSEAIANKNKKKKAPPKAENAKNDKKGSSSTPKVGGKGEKQPAKSKKRKGSNASNPDNPGPAASAVPVLEYMCEWAGCKRCFDSARLVFIHVTKTHVPPAPESLCHWEGCEPLQRKRWSLITHLQDHHCSEMAQRQACHRRFQAAQAQASGGGAQSSGNPPPAPALVYPPDAALQAIKRFHIRPPFTEFSEQREGPVTKHIRLTAALILRNLARYSSHGRSLIKRWERQLSYVTMSAVESSTALSNCLWEILHDT
ncbi:hypothetical protein BaRGS_00005717 [Batillaria attramentaria]|uniref:ARID domain-containing protein n=1 Tax=Batillaria attramentaria TaxID=370345 RepID=A0ABD0LVA6_9CAEN